MRLPDALVLERAGGLVRLELGIDATHPCFDGHFPGRPLLPGVVQIDWAIRFAAQHLGDCTPFLGFGPVKFMRLVAPPVTLELRLERDAVEGVLRFEYRVGEAVCSRGRIAFGPHAP